MLFTSSLFSCSPQSEYAATPLITASGENHIEVARFLVEHGASVNYQTKVFFFKYNLFVFLIFLCLIMPHFCIPPQYGNSSLQAACDNGNTNIVKLLIQSNANIELKNKVGFVMK